MRGTSKKNQADPSMHLYVRTSQARFFRRTQTPKMSRRRSHENKCRKTFAPIVIPPLMRSFLSSVSATKVCCSASDCGLGGRGTRDEGARVPQFICLPSTHSRRNSRHTCSEKRGEGHVIRRSGHFLLTSSHGMHAKFAKKSPKRVFISCRLGAASNGVC